MSFIHIIKSNCVIASIYACLSCGIEYSKCFACFTHNCAIGAALLASLTVPWAGLAVQSCVVEPLVGFTGSIELASSVGRQDEFRLAFLALSSVG